MTRSEKVTYLAQLEARLLEHRYRYYGLDDPVLEDFVYDFIEKKVYAPLGAELGVPTPVMDLVDWNIAFPGAAEAKVRVDSGTDNYSLWLAEVQLVWDRIGPPRYVLKSEAK